MRNLITKANQYFISYRVKINTVLLLVLLILVIILYLLVRHTAGICLATN